MWTTQDQNDLETAVRLLENPGFLIKATNSVGSVLETGLKNLPEKAQETIVSASQKALETVMDIAISTMNGKEIQTSSNWLHTGMAVVSGAVGGVFGLSALLVELPVTTGIMMRSIADIARSEGHDIESADIAVQCLSVFALGSKESDKDDESEIGYYVVRSALAKSVSEASSYLLSKTGAEQSAPVLVRLIATIASRFNITVTEKAIAQAVPVIGAVGGAAINAIFMDHYQDMARGHFVIMRLEKKHGGALVQERYRNTALAQRQKKKLQEA